jgi:hypothetical protein
MGMICMYVYRRHMINTGVDMMSCLFFLPLLFFRQRVPVHKCNAKLPCMSDSLKSCHASCPPSFPSLPASIIRSFSHFLIVNKLLSLFLSLSLSRGADGSTAQGAWAD